MEGLRKTSIGICLMYISALNILFAQSWIETNKTPSVNYFADLPDAGKWVELIMDISRNPAVKIKVLQEGKIFYLILAEECVTVEIGPPHVKSPTLRKIQFGYSYRNNITNESVHYVIYDSSATQKAYLLYKNTSDIVTTYMYYENREEKYEVRILGNARVTPMILSRGFS